MGRSLVLLHIRNQQLIYEINVLSYKTFSDGLCTVFMFGVIIALGCLSLFWRQLDPVKMIPDQCVSRPAKSSTFLCRRLVKTPLAKRVSPISPALGHQDRVGESSPLARHTG